LRDQIASMQRAQPDPLDQYLDAYFAGATPNERQWLRANVHYLQNAALVHHAAGIALQRGVPRDSPEFLSFVSQLLDQHHAAMQAQAAPPPMPPMPPPVAHVDIEKAESPEGEPEQESVEVHHVSAPVSRGDHGTAVEPELSPSQVRLSKAEREHAAAAGVSDEVYAREKLRMMKRKKAKVIKDD
jgi:hypothetical protein